MWIDYQSLDLTEPLAPQLALAIKSADLFLVLSSPHSHSSRWVQFELSLAVLLGKLIRVICLGDKNHYLPRRNGTRCGAFTHSLPFGIGEMEINSDLAERNAAWEFYIELTTRVALQGLTPQKGLVREAMNSLYILFGSTREILRKAGPKVGASHDSVGEIAIAVLNNGLRPFLSKWHPLLQEWEEQKAEGVSPQRHERAWEQEIIVRGELDALRADLAKYAEALGEICGVQK